MSSNMHVPDLSILVPNFNNGVRSSRDRSVDLLGNLMESLHRTLADDPARVEIIIADDGSTDDSLQTAREWSARKWPCGRPFCRVDVLEHSGSVSRVMNHLLARASGRLVCKMDGDIVCLTPRWASRIIGIFDSDRDRVGVVGPMQLLPDGTVHAAGDWLVHPRGYHHVGQGCAPEQVDAAWEVDHVMGCFWCARREAVDQVGGFDESIRRGQTVDIGIRIRQHGWTVMHEPTIRFEHHHVNRGFRDNTADTPLGLADSLNTFRRTWGFCRLAPDLEEVLALHGTNGICWNRHLLDPTSRSRWLGQQPPALQQWNQFVHDTRWQAESALLVERATAMLQRPGARAIQVGSGCGIQVHLAALGGMLIDGAEESPDLVRDASELSGQSSYPSQHPRFILMEDHTRVPVQDGAYDLVILSGILERHWNPVGLLKEAARIMGHGGSCLVITEPRPDDVIHEDAGLHRYRAHELNQQLRHTGLFQFGRDASFGDDPLVMELQASPGPINHGHFRRPALTR